MFAALLLLSFSQPLAPISAEHASTAPLALDQADEQYQFIAGLCEQGHFEMAVKESLRFLEDYPRHSKAKLTRYRLASALFELDRPKEAAPHYRQLAKSKGFEYLAETFLRLGQCELLEGRYSQAKQALSAAFESDQDYLKPSAAFFLGEAQFHLKNFAAAREHYGIALASKDAETYHAHARRGVAWSHFKLESFPASVQAAQRFLKDHAGHELESEVRFLLGDAASKAEQPQVAKGAWSRIESGPYLAPALRGRAYLESQAGDDRAAAKLFARLLELEPKGDFAQESAVQCGAHLLRAGAPQEALRVLMNPAAGDAAESLYWRARAQAESGDRETALKTLERAQGRAQGELAARIATARGDLLYDLGRLEESAAAYESDSSDYALHAAATAQLNAGRAEEALRIATRFCDQHSRSPYLASTRMVQAEALFQLDRFAEAMGAYSALISDPKDLDPEEQARTHARLGWCHYRLQELGEAARSFGEVTRRFPKSSEADQARYMEGRALAESDRSKEAGSVWASYLTQHPQGEHASEVRLQLARLGAGQEHLETLLESSPDDPLAAIALFELAESRSSAGEHAQAIDAYQRYLRQFPKDESAPQAHYGLAWSQRAQGEHRAALAAIENLLKTKPEGELLLAGLEMAMWSAKDLGDARICAASWQRFSQSCKEEARLVAAARVVARSLQDVGEAALARQLYAQLRGRLAEAPLVLDLLIEEIWVCIEASQTEGTDPLFSEALSKAPGDARVQEAAFFGGEARFDAGQFKQAIPLYQAAANEANGELYDDALYKLGFAHLSAEAHRPAAQAFQTLVERQPKSELHGESLYLAGECQYRAGQLKACVELLSRYRKAVPRHATRAKALFRLGQAAGELGQAELSADVLTELLKSFPDFERRVQATLEQGRALVALKRNRAARAAFDAVLKDSQSKESAAIFAARARIEIGRLHFGEGDFDEALSQFLKVSLLYGDGDEVREATLLAGMCLEKQGERDLAIAQYRKLAEQAPKSEQGQAALARLREMKVD